MTINTKQTVDTLGLINTEYTYFETTLSFHHLSVVQVRIGIDQKYLILVVELYRKYRNILFIKFNCCGKGNLVNSLYQYVISKYQTIV